MNAPTIIPYPLPLKGRPVRSRLTHRALRTQSPVTGYQRVSSPIDARWEFEITLPTMSDDGWGAVEAFFARLDGGAVFFRAHDPHRSYTRGMAAGINYENPINNAVDAAWLDGTSFDDGTGWTEASSFGSIASNAPIGATHVLLSGLVASQAVSLKENDRLEIGGLLYMAVKTASSDANGQALVEIRPRLRMPATAGDQVSFVNPSSVFTILDSPLMENSPGGYTSLGNTGFTLTEVPEALLASAGLPV